MNQRGPIRVVAGLCVAALLSGPALQQLLSPVGDPSVGDETLTLAGADTAVNNPPYLFVLSQLSTLSSLLPC